jgi:hypothetical protein
MHPDAILQASERLNRAKQAIEAMEAEEPAASLEMLWLDFLLAAHGVYLKLEKGAQGNPKSRHWFGKVKHERKTDPLLRYLHQARNAGEHGLSRPTKRTNTYIMVPPGGAVALVVTAPGEWTAQAVRGELEFPNDIIRLVAVYDDRSDNWYQPPVAHLGQPLADTTPLGVATAAIAYLERLIGAASLP